MGRLSTLLHRLQPQCVSCMTVTPSSDVLFPPGGKCPEVWAVAARPVLIASAVRLDLAASHVVNCLALQAHSGSRPAAIATAVRLTSGLARLFKRSFVSAQSAYSAWTVVLLCSWTCCSTSDPTAMHPGPSIVMCEVNGDAAPRPRTSGNKQTDGTARHGTAH